MTARNSRLEVEAAQHVVRASIDWCGGNLLNVDLSEGSEAHVEVSNPHGPLRGRRVMRRAPGAYLLLRLRAAWQALPIRASGGPRRKSTKPLDCHGPAGYSAPRRQGGTAAEH